MPVDTSEVDQLVKELATIRRKSIPFAVRDTLNRQAFEGRKVWAQKAKETMKLRSAWTVRSMQIEKATGTAIDSMQSELGSVAGYMLTQEEGATEAAKGSHGVPLPAASPGMRKRRGKVAKANAFKGISITKKNFKGSRQVRNAGVIAYTARHGGGVVFLQLRRRAGLFRISGTEKAPKIKKVWDLSKRQVVIGKNSTLQATSAEMAQKQDEFMAEALRKQLAWCKRIGIER